VQDILSGVEITKCVEALGKQWNKGKSKHKNGPGLSKGRSGIRMGNKFYSPQAFES